MTGMQDYAQDAAAAMGDGWHAEPGYDNDDAFIAADASVERVHIRCYDGNVEVRGCYPDTGYHYRGDEQFPTVNVSFARGAKALAAAIERRLFPKYLPVLRKVAAENARAAGQLHSCQVLGRRMAALIPGGQTDDRRPARVTQQGGGRSGCIDAETSYDGRTVTLRICELPGDVALRVLEVIAAELAAVADSTSVLSEGTIRT